MKEATAKEKSDRMNVFLPAPQDGGTLPKLLSDPHRSGTISSGGTDYPATCERTTLNALKFFLRISRRTRRVEGRNTKTGIKVETPRNERGQ